MAKKLLVLLMTILIVSCNDSKTQKTSDALDEVESNERKDNTNNPVDENSSNTSNLNGVDFSAEVKNFITCKKAATERNDCRNSITKIITKTYDLTEFNDPKLGYVVYDSIRPIVERSREWLQLGSINQETINQALAHTNRGGLSLIIDTANTYGHVVMIIPGETKKSGSWAMKLPNVLSLTNYKPEKSFYNKSLSYAMQKSDDLKIFLRQ
ncbi:hypothetical protein [Aquimarina algiphila]|uniref:hypothetical protein n=1 Tax=Aquimarina algiphila TaxID=2047982 RepID=UPI00232EB15B|nr:hypothetical protein [Aquimarina algiphila]